MKTYPLGRVQNIMRRTTRFLSMENLFVGLILLVMAYAPLIGILRGGLHWKSAFLAMGPFLVLLIFLYPVGGLSLFLSTLTFDQFMITHSLSFPKVIAILVFSSWLLSLPLRKKNLISHLSKLDAFILLFLLICLAHILLFTEHSTLRHFLTYAELLCFYLMFRTEVQSRKNLQLILWFAILPAAASAFAYSIHFILGGESRVVEGFLRIYSPKFAGINVSATGYLALFGLAITCFVFRQKPLIENKRVRVSVLVTAMLAFILYILLSLSRGTWSGLFVMVLCFLILSLKRPFLNFKKAGILFLVAPLFLFALGIFWNSAVKIMFRWKAIALAFKRIIFQKLSHNAHIYLLKIALYTIIPRHPFLGVGIGNVSPKWVKYANETKGIPLMQLLYGYPTGSNAHNIFFNVAVQLGIPMFLFFLFIVWKTLSGLIHSWKKAETEHDSETVAFFKGLFSTMVGFFAAAFWLPMENSLFLYFLFAVASVAVRVLQVKHDKNVNECSISSQSV